MNRFTEFTDYVHRVYTTHKGEVFPLPVNLGTINQFFHASYTPAEAQKVIEQQAGEFTHIEPKIWMSRERSSSANLYITLLFATTPASSGRPTLASYQPVLFAACLYVLITTTATLRTPGKAYLRTVIPAWFERMIDDPRITVTLGVDFFSTRTSHITRLLW